MVMELLRGFVKEGKYLINTKKVNFKKIVGITINGKKQMHRGNGFFLAPKIYKLQ
jgi:hypothetical protein